MPRPLDGVLDNRAAVICASASADRAQRLLPETEIQ
jgi:hypothetical protein